MKECVGCNALCIVQLHCKLDYYHRTLFRLFALSEPSISFKIQFLISRRAKSLFCGVSLFAGG